MATSLTPEIILTNWIKSQNNDTLIRLLADHKYLNDTGLNSTYPKRFTPAQSVQFQQLAQKEFDARGLSNATLQQYYQEANASDKANNLTIAPLAVILETQPSSTNKWIGGIIITAIVAIVIFYIGRGLGWWGSASA